MIRAGIEKWRSLPIVGTEQQAEDLIKVYQRKPGERGKYLGGTNIFGKSSPEW